MNVEVDLSRDAFSVTYDPSSVTESQIEEAIANLGFKPRIATGEEPARAAVAPGTPIPEPIASALNEAGEAKKLVFVDFYAEWCAPCLVLEKTTIPDSRVQRALEGFVFLKVDTDLHPRAGQRFEVWGMPTLLVLDVEGQERYRHAGFIEPADLAKKLLKISESDL